MATKLLELVYTDACDAVLLMTGDTDLVPAVRTARHAPTQKDIRFSPFLTSGTIVSYAGWLRTPRGSAKKGSRSTSSPILT